jgi:hypothetical protein
MRAVIATLKRLAGRSAADPLPSMAPSLIALRRAEARRWLRSQGITHPRPVYGQHEEVAT